MLLSTEGESMDAKLNSTAQVPQAFLCYASEDKDLARRIAADLLKAGIDTFFDDWEIGAGQSLRRKIDDGIASCTHFVVLLTPKSLRIPRMEVVALERLAARDGKSVDTVLARELRDLMSAQSNWLASEIPGFTAALAWPY
jgi:hypothetical protein